MKKIFLFFGSLRLTVFLLLCSIVVLLFGTLDQANWDIWDIKKHYFEAWFTAWPKGNFDAWFGRTSEAWGRGLFLPMPGGFTLAILWLANLFCAHFRYFRLRWATVGIPFVHGGVIVLIIGGFVTACLQEEYDMEIPTGQTCDTIVESRTKKPYQLSFALHLEKFTHEYYPGTQIAKNFASAVRLKVSAEDAGRPVDIAMNKPLRHEGYTFYQMQFRPEVPGRGATTILHVVRNPGWQLPYIAMYVMGGGLLVQFLFSLGRFLKRMEPRTKVASLSLSFLCFLPGTVGAQPADAGAVPPQGEHAHHEGGGRTPPPMLPASNLPAQATATQQSTKAFLGRFAALPVQYNGRLQPIDTLARNSLLILGGKQSVALTEEEALAFGRKPSTWSVAEKNLFESAGLKFSAYELGLLEIRPVPVHRNLVGKASVEPVAFLAELAFRPQIAAHFRVFRVENAEVRALLPAKQGAVVYYSWNELLPALGEIEKLLKAEAGRAVPGRTSFDRGLSKLVDAANTYHMLSYTFAPGDVPPGRFPEDEYASWQQTLVLAAKALSSQPAPQKGGMSGGNAALQIDPMIGKAVASFVERYREQAKDGRVGIVPPRSEREKQEGRWGNRGSSLLGITQGFSLETMPVVPLYGVLCAAYQLGDTKAEEAALQNLESIFTREKDYPVQKIGVELSFNRIEPFFKILCCYMLLFLLSCLGWVLSKPRFHNVARWFAMFVFLAHTVALLARMWIQGRPPVTNTYSTAVFVAWGAVLLGLFAERFLKNGIGNAVAGIIGFVSLIIAHHLAMGGDTLKMMEAVLDSNFWLAVHVVTITLGYSAMFVAGLLGALWIVLRVFGQLPRAQTAMLERVVYGIICFALLLSFLGTMFGGIWADQSWGRFWGWDPKENGALMIVFWCAVFIHARFGGLLRVTGLMQLAVMGNIITSASWFGTNLLGIGLHSYGFSSEGFQWLLAFWIAQLILIGLGWLRSPASREVTIPPAASPAARLGGSDARYSNSSPVLPPDPRGR